MKRVALLLAVFSFAASIDAAEVVALGVGASASNVATVKINGKPTSVTLHGVPAGSDAARLFLQCLVANRVVRVDLAKGKVVMLDGNSANDHVNEYLQTKTEVEPCALGKAAYKPAKQKS